MRLSLLRFAFLAALVLLALVSQADAWGATQRRIVYIGSPYGYGYYWSCYKHWWMWSERCDLKWGYRLTPKRPPPTPVPTPPPVSPISAKFGLLKPDSYLPSETDEFVTTQRTYFQNKGTFSWSTARRNMAYTASGMWVENWKPSANGYEVACRAPGATDFAYLSPNLNSFVSFLAEVKTNTANPDMRGSSNSIVACATFTNSANGQVTLGRTTTKNNHVQTCSWNNIDKYYTSNGCRRPYESLSNCNSNSNGHDCYSYGNWRVDKSTGRRGSDPVSVAEHACTSCSGTRYVSYSWKNVGTKQVEVCANIRGVSAGGTLAIRFDVQLSCGAGSSNGYVQGQLTKVEWRKNSNTVKKSLTGSQISRSVARVYLDYNDRANKADLQVYSSFASGSSCFPGDSSVSCTFGSSLKQCNLLVNLGTVAAQSIMGEIHYGRHSANGVGSSDDTFYTSKKEYLDFCDRNKFSNRVGGCSALISGRYKYSTGRSCLVHTLKCTDTAHQYGVTSLPQCKTVGRYGCYYHDEGYDLAYAGQTNHGQADHVIVVEKGFSCGQSSASSPNLSVKVVSKNAKSASSYMGWEVSLETRMSVEKWITKDTSANACSAGPSSSNVVKPTFTSTCNSQGHGNTRGGRCGPNFNNCFCRSSSSRYRYCSASGSCGRYQGGLTDFDYQSSTALSHLRASTTYQQCWRITNTGDEALRVTNDGEASSLQQLTIYPKTSQTRYATFSSGTIASPHAWTKSSWTATAQGLVTGKTISGSDTQLPIMVAQSIISTEVKAAPEGYCTSQSTSSLSWPKGYNGFDVCYKICNTGNLHAKQNTVTFIGASRSTYNTVRGVLYPSQCYSYSAAVSSVYSSTSSSLNIPVRVVSKDADGFYKTVSPDKSATITFRDFGFKVTKTLAKKSDCSDRTSSLTVAEYANIYHCWEAQNTGSFEMRSMSMVDGNYYSKYSWRSLSGTVSPGQSKLIATKTVTAVTTSYESTVYGGSFKAYPVVGGKNNLGYKTVTFSAPKLDVQPQICDGGKTGVTSISVASSACGNEGEVRPGQRVTLTFTSSITMPNFAKPNQNGHRDPTAKFDFKLCDSSNSCTDKNWIYVSKITRSTGVDNSMSPSRYSYSQVYSYKMASRSESTMTFTVELEVRGEVPSQYKTLKATYWTQFTSESDGSTKCDLSKGGATSPATVSLNVVKPVLRTTSPSVTFASVGTSKKFSRSVTHTPGASTASAFALTIREQIDSRLEVSDIKVGCNGLGGSSAQCPFVVSFSQSSRISSRVYSEMTIKFLDVFEVPRHQLNGAAFSISYEFTGLVRNYRYMWGSSFVLKNSLIYGQSSCTAPQSYCPGTGNSRYASIECDSALTNFDNRCTKFSCRPGYRSKHSSSYCQLDSTTSSLLGKWNPQPECEVYPGYCRSSGYCSSGVINQQCYANCQKGFYMPTRPTCKAGSSTKGVWSSSTSCSLKPGYCAAESHNGKSGMTASCSASVLGTSCKPECSLGYYGNTPKCHSYKDAYGKWSPSPRCSKVRYYCPTDYVLGCSRNEIGDSCRPRCAYGYTGQSTTVHCLPNTASVGKWGYKTNPSATVCSKRSNYCTAYRGCGSGKIDETCAVSCSTGYVPTSTPRCVKRYSYKGYWSPTPGCKPDPNFCTKLSSSAIAGATRGCDSGTYGDDCDHSCSNGYEPSDAECKLSGWSPTPTCQKRSSYCRKVYLGSEVSGYYACALSSSASEIGDTCGSLNCRTGYVSRYSSHTCVSYRSSYGRWSPSPDCVVDYSYCPAKLGVAAGYYTQYKYTSCPYGYYSRVWRQRCEADRTWNPNVAACTKRSDYCRSASWFVWYYTDSSRTVLYAFQYLTCPANELGASCNHACPAGWEIAINPVCLTRYSSSGQWSTYPTCQKKAIQCPATSLCTSDGELGSKCSRSCAHGYESTEVTCGDGGAWPTPVCNLKEDYCTGGSVCYPGKLGDSCSRLARLPVGYTCDDGECVAKDASSGTWLVAACDVDNNWCPDIGYGSGAYNDVKPIICPIGHYASPSSITCQANHQWTDMTPECIKRTNYCRASTDGQPCNGGAVIGGACNVLCPVGYEHPGAVCVAGNTWTGKWSPDQPCSIRQDICAAEGAVSYQVGGLPSGDYDEVVSFTCQLGYRPIPSSGTSKCSYYGEVNGVQQFRWSTRYCVAAAGYCPSLSPANGQVISQGYINNQRNVYCNNGYTAQTSPITCLADLAQSGKWSASAQCLKKTGYCAATTVCPSKSLGESCSPSCDNGYEPSVNSVTCVVGSSISGSFSPTATCSLKANYCSSTPATAHGSGCAGAKLGEACSFSCAPGYQAANAPQCGAGGSVGGTWSAVPQCEAIAGHCSSLSVANSVSGCNNGAINDVCTPVCGDGFRLTGTATCGASGSWSPAPQCEVVPGFCSASTVGDLSAGTRGSTQSVTCPVGYAASGTATCTGSGNSPGAGTWSPAPSCTLIVDFCQHSQCNAAALGGVCSPTCSSGFESAGDVTCSSSGSFSPAPACNKIAGYCAADSSADQSPWENAGCDAAVLGASCGLACGKGYTANSPSCTINTATSGTWNPAPDCSAKPSYCAATSTTLYAVSELTAAGIQETRSLTCQNGFQPTQASYTCTSYDFNSGVWNPQPKCEPIPNLCAAPAQGANVASVCGAGEAGEACTFTCELGFTPSNTPQCTATGATTGAYSPAPACRQIEDYCPAITIANSASGCDAANIDEQCPFNCNPGYKPNSQDIFCDESTAQQGLFTSGGAGTVGSAPECIAVACPARSTFNGNSCECPMGFNNNIGWNDADDVWYGGCEPVQNYCSAQTPQGSSDGCAAVAMEGTCDLNCNIGWEQVSADPVCTAGSSNSPGSGVWSVTAECRLVANYCSASTGTVNVATEASGAQLGDSASFACAQGYDANTPVCMVGADSSVGSGIWSPAPACTPTKDNCAPTTPAFASSGCESADTEGSCVGLTCNLGYKVTSTGQCQGDGSFAPAPACGEIAGYCASPSVNNGVNCAAGNIGSSCTPVCNAGYEANTASCTTSTASSGAWSPAPACSLIANFCPAVSVAQSTSTCDVRSLGATCSPSCANGYRLTTSATCQADGSWSATPVCELIPDFCGGLNAAEFSTSSCADAALGASCQITCQTGYESLSSATCGADQQWSLTPQCTPVANWCDALVATGGMSVGCDSTSMAGECTSLDCNFGYQLNTDSVTCTADKSFQPTAECSLITEFCPMLNITHGQSFQASPIDTQYNPVCDAGYAAPVGAFGRCVSTTSKVAGIWSPVPVCNLIVDYCPAVTSALFASGCPDDRSLDEVCTPTCVEGHYLSSSATCQSDGTWSSTPTCIPYDDFCVASVNTIFSTSECTQGVIGSSCSKTCEAGYAPSAASSTCVTVQGSTRNGEYSPAITCEPIADWCAASSDAHGASCGALDMAESCTASFCENGYMNTNGLQHTCTADKSLSPAIACSLLPAYCPTTSYDNGGSCAETTLGSACTVQCDTGYTTASTTATCVASALRVVGSGLWSPAPSCSQIPDFCKAATAEHVSQGCSDSAFEAPCEVKCDTGYYPENAEVDCGADGQWSAAIKCIPFAEYCTADEIGDNAATACAAGQIGASCAVTCQAGYENLLGASTCQGTENYSGAGEYLPASSCTPKPDLCAAVTPAHATVGCATLDMAEVCSSITCDFGYEATESNFQCGSDGQLSPIPECTKVDNYCASISAAFATTGCGTAEIGGACTAVCGSGYSLTSGVSTCVEGDADSGVYSPLPVCEKTPGFCGEMAPANSASSCAASKLAETCSYTCATGFAPKVVGGLVDPTCTVDESGNGAWSFQAECVQITDFCKATVSALYLSAQVPNGVLGAEHTVACEIGFEPKSASGKVSCVVSGSDNGSGSGDWVDENGDAPECTLRANYCSVFSPENTATGCGAANITQFCTGMTCQSGYQATDMTNYAQCRPDMTKGGAEGYFFPAPGCELIPNFCAQISAVEHSQLGCAGKKLGESCGLVCDDGYEASAGDPVCTSSEGNGVFSPAPACTPIANYCPATDAGANSLTGCPSGDMEAECISITCDDFYNNNWPECVSVNGVGVWQTAEGAAPGCDEVAGPPPSGGIIVDDDTTAEIGAPSQVLAVDPSVVSSTGTLAVGEITQVQICLNAPNMEGDKVRIVIQAPEGFTFSPSSAQVVGDSSLDFSLVTGDLAVIVDDNGNSVQQLELQLGTVVPDTDALTDFLDVCFTVDTLASASTPLDSVTKQSEGLEFVSRIYYEADGVTKYVTDAQPVLVEAPRVQVAIAIKDENDTLTRVLSHGTIMNLEVTVSNANSMPVFKGHLSIGIPHHWGALPTTVITTDSLGRRRVLEDISVVVNNDPACAVEPVPSSCLNTMDVTLSDETTQVDMPVLVEWDMEVPETLQFETDYQLEAEVTGVSTDGTFTHSELIADPLLVTNFATYALSTRGATIWELVGDAELQPIFQNVEVGEVVTVELPLLMSTGLSHVATDLVYKNGYVANMKVLSAEVVSISPNFVMYDNHVDKNIRTTIDVTSDDNSATFHVGAGAFVVPEEFAAAGRAVAVTAKVSVLIMDVATNVDSRVLTGTASLLYPEQKQAVGGTVSFTISEPSIDAGVATTADMNGVISGSELTYRVSLQNSGQSELYNSKFTFTSTLTGETLTQTATPNEAWSFDTVTSDFPVIGSQAVFPKFLQVSFDMVTALGDDTIGVAGQTIPVTMTWTGQSTDDCPGCTPRLYSKTFSASLFFALPESDLTSTDSCQSNTVQPVAVGDTVTMTGTITIPAGTTNPINLTLGVAAQDVDFLDMTATTVTAVANGASVVTAVNGKYDLSAQTWSRASTDDATTFTYTVEAVYSNLKHTMPKVLSAVATFCYGEESTEILCDDNVMELNVGSPDLIVEVTTTSEGRLDAGVTVPFTATIIYADGAIATEAYPTVEITHSSNFENLQIVSVTQGPLASPAPVSGFTGTGSLPTLNAGEQFVIEYTLDTNADNLGTVLSSRVQVSTPTTQCASTNGLTLVQSDDVTIASDGIYGITYYGEDDYFNVGNCTFDVTFDTTPPVISCPAQEDVCNDESYDYHVYYYTIPTVSDNLAGFDIATITMDPQINNGTNAYQVGFDGVVTKWCINDLAGNTGCCTSSLKVEDCEAPLAVCEDVTLYTAAGSSKSAPYDANVLVSSSDNVGVATSTQFDTTFEYPVGASTLFYSACDAAGNCAGCSSIVTVIDNEAPTVTCPPDSEQCTDAGRAYWESFYGFVPVASDNDAIVPPLEWTDVEGKKLPLGPHDITISIYDASGNLGNCTFHVEVKDCEPPVPVTCPLDFVHGTFPGQNYWQAVWNTPTFSDNYQVTSVTEVSGLSNTNLIVGHTYHISYIAYDFAQNYAWCNFSVTIIDDEPPTAVCHNHTMYNAANSNGNTYVLINSGTDNVGVVSESYVTIPQNDFYTMGTHVVTYSVSDAAGLSDSCDSYIFVLPTCGDAFLTPPEECDGGVDCDASCQCPTGYVANDAKGCKVVCPVDSTDPECGYNGTCEITIDTTPATILNGEEIEIELIDIIDSLTDGQTEVDRVATQLGDEFEWTVVESSTYTEGDFEASAQHAIVEACCPYTYQPTMWVEVNGVLVNTVDHCRSEHAAAVAAGTVVYERTYNDTTGCWYFPTCQAGNATIGQAKNETGSMVDCKDGADITATLGLDQQYAYPTWADSDIYSVLPPYVVGTPVEGVSFSVTKSHSSGDGFVLGTTTVSYTFDEGNGSPQTCTFVVTVTDLIVPRMECPFDDVTPTQYETDVGYGYATVLFDPTTYYSPLTGQTEQGAFDWGDYSTVTVTTTGVSSNNRYAPGSYTITWSATDSSSNTATCTFTFTVVDNQPPQITCQNYSFPTNVGSTSGTISGVTVTAYDFLEGSLSADRNCCRICQTGKACGNGCISESYTCNQAPGCACDVEDTEAEDGTDTTLPTSQDLSDGPTAFQYCASDSYSNEACCIVWIEIYDAEPPVITCPSDLTIPLTSSPPFTASSIPVTAYDPQGDATISCTFNGTSTVADITVDPTGLVDATLSTFEQDISITCQATDLAGQTDDCVFSVNLVDIAPPVVTCPDDILIVNNASSMSDISLPNVGSFPTSDNDVPSDSAGHTASYVGTGPSNPFPNPFPTTTYTAEVFDLAGNRGTCSYTITVLDSNPPCSTCPSDVHLFTSTAGVSASAGFTEPTFFDCDSGDQYTATAHGDAAIYGSIGALTPENSYAMSYSGADASGNTMWCNFTVTYDDDVEPTVTDCVEESQAEWVIVEANEYGVAEYSWSLSSTDDVTASGSIVWLSTSPNGNMGSGQSGTELLAVGQHVFHHYVQDLAGNWNSVAKCAKKVWVVDTTPPSLTCALAASGITARSQDGQPVSVCFPGSYASATDARSPLSYAASPASCSLFAVGTHTVTVTVTDPDCSDALYPNVPCGLNAASCTFDVTVTSPYPEPNFDAVLLKSVIAPIAGEVGADGNQKFGAVIDFITAVRNPHQVNTNPNTVALSVSNSVQAEAGAIAYVAGEGAANVNDGESYFQTWSIAVDFTQCDVADQTFTIDFQTLCVASSADPCLLGSYNQQVVISFKAEDFCQNKLSDILVTATLKTYTASDLAAYQAGTALPATPTTDFALGDVVGAVVEAESQQVLFKRIDMVRARRDYYYTSLARQNNNPSDVFYTHSPVFADATTGTATSGTGSAFGSAADFATPVVNAAWFSFTEDVDPVQVFNNNNEAYPTITATVAVRYSLDAQDSAAGRRRVLKLLTQDVPKGVDAFGLDAMRRRSMQQDQPLSSTEAEATAQTTLSPRKSTAGSSDVAASGVDESGVPKVVYYAIAVVIAMFVFCCICVGGCFYVSKAKLLPEDPLEEGDLAKPQATLHLSPRQDTDALRVHSSPRV